MVTSVPFGKQQHGMRASIPCRNMGTVDERNKRCNRERYQVNEEVS